MNYSEEQKKEIIEKIFNNIKEGHSLRRSLSNFRLSSSTFYIWIDENKEWSKQYARACEERADVIFEEILEIAEHTEEDHTAFTGINVIQRDRLRIDSRKWMLGKMMPKKYGDKIDIDHTTNGESINVINLGVGINPDESTD